MLGPVHWGIYPGEYLELAMAVLVVTDVPGTLRRRPASGDGGIDLMVPDGDGWEIRQIKRFTQSLTTKQKGQIKKSYKDVRNDPRLRKPITAYRLVIPLDPTPGEQGWFEGLVDGAPWPAQWWGENHWHELAAKHPHVIDYFFGDGKARVVERSMELQSAIRNPDEPLTPVFVADVLAKLGSSLNKDDPFYRYDVATSPTPPTGDPLPGAVFVETTQVSDGTFVTVTLTPRYPEAVEDRPIDGDLTISIDDPAAAAEFRQQYEDFHVYGRALDLPEGSVSVTINAPGGLGGTITGAGGRIGTAAVGESSPPCRLVTVDPAGNLLAELKLNCLDPTRGAGGGAEVRLTDDAGVIDGILRLHPPDPDGHGRANFTFSVRETAGEPLMPVLPAMRLLRTFRAPNRGQLRPEFGATVYTESEVGDDEYLDEVVFDYFENLAYLQALATKPVLVPDMVERRWAAELDQTVRMLKGEVLTDTWDEITLELTVPRSKLKGVFAADSGALALERNMLWDIGGEQVDLGPFTTICSTARLADKQPKNTRKAILVPGDDPTMTRRAGPLVPT